MTKKRWRFVTLRPVGNRKRGKDISQAPEFKRLVEVQREMNNDEKIRTNQYLEERMKEGISLKTNRRFTMGNNTTYRDDWKPEIVYCRAIKCIRNQGSGKCRITRADDKISVDEEGRCIQYFCG